MIVLGADTHKRPHTVAAIKVKAGTGEVVGEQTIAVGARGFRMLLGWARGALRARCSITGGPNWSTREPAYGQLTGNAAMEEVEAPDAAAIRDGRAIEAGGEQTAGALRPRAAERPPRRSDRRVC